MHQATLQELLAEQINTRCDISKLYADLLRLAPASPKFVSAAHDWSLRNIDTLVRDLVLHFPNRMPPANPYSQYFLMAGISPTALGSVLDELVAALHEHSALSTRIEQYGKGVF